MRRRLSDDESYLRWKAAFCLWNADVPSRDQIRDWKDSRQPTGSHQRLWRLGVAGERFRDSLERIVRAVEGLVYLTITGEEWERLTAFEDDFYELQEVTVECPETGVSAPCLYRARPRGSPSFRTNPGIRIPFGRIILRETRWRRSGVVGDASVSRHETWARATNTSARTSGLRSGRIKEFKMRGLALGKHAVAAREALEPANRNFFDAAHIVTDVAW